MSGGDAMLSCHLCGYLASSPVYLAQHQRRHGLEYEGPWRTCDHCSFATRSVQDFRAHSKQHPRELTQDFKCSDCGRNYQTFRNLARHRIQVHKKDTLRAMEEGQQHAGSSDGSSPTGNTFQCSECEFTCKSHGSMWYHQKKMHPTEEDKQKEWHCCQICGLTFVYKQRYYAHMEQYHALSMDEQIDSEELPMDEGSTSHEESESSPSKNDLRPGQLIIKSETLSDNEQEGDMEQERGWVDHDYASEELMLSQNEMGGMRSASEGDLDIENGESSNGNSEEAPPSLRQMLERGPSPGRLSGTDDIYERRHAGVGFPCDDCDFVGASSSGLWYHRRKVHEPGKMANCPHCDYTAVSSRDVQKHLRKHTNERPFDCMYCERNFTQKNHLFNHIITIHKGEKLPTEKDEIAGSSPKTGVQSPNQEDRPFLCNQCGRAFARKNLLQLHKMTHGMAQDPNDNEQNDEQVEGSENVKVDSDVAGPSGGQKQITIKQDQCKCNICTKSGPNMVGFSYLRETVGPGGKKRFECSLCRKIFGTLCKCLGHIKLLHANSSGNPYKCRNCGKCFLAVTSLCGHMRAHRERKKFSFQCGICDKVFQIGETLKRHAIAFHSKDISKEALAAAAKQSSKLKLKIRLPKISDKLQETMARDEQKQSMSDQSSSPSHGRKRSLPKTMTCSKCGQSFTQGNSYVRHMCKHLNIVPFDCKKCGKLFSSQAVLKAHMQHHNNTQMYQCIRCPFRAKYLTQLYTHMEKHFGKGVHGCVYCTTRFTKKSNIKKHILTKHRGKRLAFEDYTATVQAEDEEMVEEEEQTTDDRQSDEPDVTSPQPHPVSVYPAPTSISPSRQTTPKQAPAIGNMRVEISQPDSSQIAEDRPPSTLSSEGSVHTSVSATPTQAKNAAHQQKDIRPLTMPSPIAKKEPISDQKCSDCMSKTSSNLKCSHCGIIFLDMVMHTIHMGWHGRSDPFECHACGRNCGDKYGFITHIFREPHN